jgi:formate hydrogenlyase transcriptional activator
MVDARPDVSSSRKMAHRTVSPRGSEATLDEDVALRKIVEGVESETGEGFLRSLVRCVTEALGVAYAFVSELDADRGVFRTLAVWGHGQLLANFELPLAGTPCEGVLRGQMAHYADRVQQRFPEDHGLATWEVESYCGAPLLDRHGAVLGHLAIFDTRPMLDARGLSILRIFAARACAEIEREHISRRLRENERLFRDLYDEAPVAYWYITQEGKIDRVNRAMAEMFGRPREFFVGRTLHDLYANTPRGIPAALEVRRRIFAGEEVRGEELEARRADGSSFWIRISVSPEFDAAGHAIGGRITAIDLSAEKRAEQAVRVSEYLAQEIRAAHNVDEIVGRSPVLMGVLEKVRLVAETDTSVLILGETGTGKELMARALHSASRRKNRPLIKVNCAALPSGLIESELFGHEKGSFTGASERRVGRFELADGGTIFLDEIGEVPPDVQVKLLRVLQEREIERVGGNKTIGVDVRVVAATNRDLKGAVAAGKFRQDLFYRLNVFPIDLPPLRERPEDIRLLVRYFVGRYATKIGRRISRVPEKLLERLLSYAWPGNVRELENVIERAVILSKGPELEVISELPASIPLPAAAGELTAKPSLGEPGVAGPSDLKLTNVERDHILTTLKRSGWRIEGPTGAAHLLGLNPSTLRSRMKKLGIERSREALS